MNETYLAWLVLSLICLLVLPFFGAAMVNYQPPKGIGLERIKRAWFVGLGVVLGLLFIAIGITSLIWALSVVTK